MHGVQMVQAQILRNPAISVIAQATHQLCTEMDDTSGDANVVQKELLQRSPGVVAMFKQQCFPNLDVSNRKTEW